MARFKHIERVDEIAKLECENQECSSCQFRDNYSTCMERYTNNLIYDTAYQEVAREIFEEIEPSLVIGGFVNGEKYYAIREDDYNHYKKKYTESEDK